MDQQTGSSASAAGPKKDKKSKKSYDDGDGKKKFVSIPLVQLPALSSCNHQWGWAPNCCTKPLIVFL